MKKFKQNMLVGLAFAIIVILVSSWIAVNKFEQQNKKDIAEYMNAILETAHQGYHSWADRHYANINLWVKDIEPVTKALLKISRTQKDLTNSPFQSQIRDFLKPLYSGNDYEGFFIISPDNTNLASSRDINIGKTNILAKKENVLQKIWSGETIISFPMHSDVPLKDKDGKLQEKRATMFVGTPVKDESGAIIAIFTLRINPDKDFTAIFERARMGKSGETYCVDGQGRMVSNSRFHHQLIEMGLVKPNENDILTLTLTDPGVNLVKGEKRKLSQKKRPLTKMAQSLIAGKSGIDMEGYRNYRGVSVIGIWMWDNEDGFGIATEIDMAEAFQTHNFIKLIVRVLTFISVLALFGLTSLFYWRRKRLYESEERFRSLYENSIMGLYRTTPDGQIVLANPTLVKMLGFDSFEELAKKNLEKTGYAESTERKKFKEILDRKNVVNRLEAKWLRKDGTILFVTESAKAVKDRYGNIIYYDGTVENITIQKQVEEEIKGLAEQHSLMKSTGLYGYWLIDENGKLIDINDQYCQMSGYTRDELLNFSIQDLEVINKPEDVASRIERIIKNGTELFESKHRTKDGRIIDVEISMVYWLSQRKFIAFIRDITDRKQADLALKESEKKFRVVIESNPSAIFIVQDEQFVFVNPSAVELTGYSVDELIGKNFLELVHPNQREMVEKNAKDRLAGRPVPSRYNLRYLTKSGKSRWLDFTPQDINYDGKRALIATGIDITESKKAEKELLSLSERLHLATSGGRIGIWELDMVNDKLIWDDTMYLLYGITVDSFSGAFEAWEKSLHPDDLLRGQEEILMALRGEKQFDTEFRVIWPDKSIHYIKANALIQRDASGKPLRMVGTNLDITESKTAREEILKLNESLEFRVNERTLELQRTNKFLAEEISERKQVQTDLMKTQTRLQFLLTSAPVVIYTSSVEHPFGTTYIGENIKTLLGYRPEQFIEDLNFWAGKIHPEDAPRIFNEFSHLFEAGNHTREYRLMHNDGIYRWVRDELLIIRNEDGSPKELLGYWIDITNRKKAEELLTQSEARFRDVALSMSDVVWEIDTEMRYVYASAAFANSGYTVEEMIGKTIFDFMASEELERVRPFYLDLAKNKKHLNDFENRLITKDGRIVISLSSAVPLLDKEGVLQGYRGVSKDITQQKQAKDVLNQFKTTLDQTLDCVFMFYPDTFKFFYVNQGATKQVGYSYDELLEMTPIDIKPEFTETSFRKVIAPLIAGEQYSMTFETIHQHKNGTFVPVEILLQYICPVEEQPRFVAVVRDITTRKESEKKLQHKIKEISDYKLALDESSIVAITDKEGKINYVNDYFCIISKFSRKELIGQNHRKISSGFHSKEFFKELWTTISSGKIWRGEIKDKAKDGSFYWLDSTIVPFLDENNKPYQYIIIRTDITESKHIAGELEKAKEVADNANQIKSEFLANMSHEIRTPMNAIIGFAELLSNTEIDKQQKNYLESLKSSGKSLLSLINEILNLSKIEAGKLELHYDYVHTRNFFSEIKDIFTIAATNKDLDLISEIDKKIPVNIYVDDLRLRQILINLVSNAIKFTEKGYVKISISCSNLKTKKIKGEELLHHDLIISIEDTGKGIVKEQKEKLFEPFTQASSQTARIYGGTGLGLTITKKFIQLMNGTITIESQLDKGSIFTVHIPDVQASNELMAMEDEQDELAFNLKFNPATIVIVDDIKDNRKYLSEALKQLGFKVHSTDNGELALSLVQKVNPDLIITDLRMPIMDGHELLDELQKVKKIKKIPVIATSASIVTNKLLKLNSSKFDGFLSKPILINELKKILTRFIPYTKETIDEQTISLSDKAIEFLPGVMQKLENEFHDDWIKFKNRKPIKEILLFGENLHKLGIENKNDIVTEYADSLIKSAKNYDIDLMITLVQEYKNIISKLKNYLVKQ